jgi:hypothetical protein
MAKMNQPQAMTPVLRAITTTLTSDHYVWLVGSIPIVRSSDAPPGPTPLPPEPSEMPTGWWMGSYLFWWNQQITTLVLDHEHQQKTQTIVAPGPVSRFEDVSVVRFAGYHPDNE